MAHACADDGVPDVAAASRARDLRVLGFRMDGPHVRDPRSLRFAQQWRKPHAAAVHAGAAPVRPARASRIAIAHARARESAAPVQYAPMTSLLPAPSRRRASTMHVQSTSPQDAR